MWWRERPGSGLCLGDSCRPRSVLATSQQRVQDYINVSLKATYEEAEISYH
jgi:hypothetical protein